MVHDVCAVLVEPSLTERVVCTCNSIFRIEVCGNIKLFVTQDHMMIEK